MTRCVRLFRNKLSFYALCWCEKERQFLTMLHNVELLSRNSSFLIFTSLNWTAFMFCCLLSVPSSSAAKRYLALPEVCVKKYFNTIWCQIQAMGWICSCSNSSNKNYRNYRNFKVQQSKFQNNFCAVFSREVFEILDTHALQMKHFQYLK